MRSNELPEQSSSLDLEIRSNKAPNLAPYLPPLYGMNTKNIINQDSIKIQSDQASEQLLRGKRWNRKYYFLPTIRDCRIGGQKVSLSYSPAMSVAGDTSPKESSDMQNTFDEFYNDLKEAYDSGTPSFFNNKDRVHNAAIMKLMFDTSDEVKMYCGEMTVLRNNFYEHITHDAKSQEESDNLNEIDNKNLKDEVKEEENIGEKAKEKVSEAFTKFLKDKKGKLTIYLETFKPEYLEDIIFDKDLLKNPNLIINVLPKEVKAQGLAHTACTNDQSIVRIETNAVDHQAICRVNKPAEPNNDKSTSQSDSEEDTINNPVSKGDNPESNGSDSTWKENIRQTFENMEKISTAVNLD